MPILAEFPEWAARLTWGPFTIFLVIAVGLLFSVRTGFFQLRHAGLWCRMTVGSLFRRGGPDKSRDPKAISPFQSLTVALAGTMGTGNIVGVAAAIALGGPGAVFWMWIAAILGMMTCYAENVLGIMYRKRTANGEWLGGPMQYMEHGLGARWLAVIFAGACILSSFGMGNIVQVHSLSQAAEKSWSVPPLLTGIITAVIVGVVLFGGLKRIVSFTERLIPALSLCYIAACLIVITAFAARIPQALSQIFSTAFSPSSAAGGVLGVMMIGIRRGVATNEAGLGGSVMVHSCADVKHPAIQGMWGIFEVFADTLVVCTLTALVILTSGADYISLDGAPLSIAAFETVFGGFADVFITISIALFAFSTIIGWSCYGERSFIYLFGDSRVWVYRLLYTLITAAGSMFQLHAAWDLSDALNGLMALPNLIALALLSPQVISATKEYLNNEMPYS